MKVIYSVGSTLGVGGVGVHAGEAVEQLVKAGVLDRAICAGISPSDKSYASVFPPDSPRGSRGGRGRNTVTVPVEAPWKIPGHRYFYPNWLKDTIFDAVSSVSVFRNTDTDHPRVDENHYFHSWNGHCLWTAREARRRGIKTVVERNSLYPLEQEAVLKQEFKKFGLNYRPTHPISLKRTVQELQEADFIACPSKLVYESLLTAGLPKEKIWQPNPLGVNFEKFALSRSPASSAGRQKPEASSQFNFIFVGGDPIRKGLYYLLQAWWEIIKSPASSIERQAPSLFLLGLPPRTFDSAPFSQFKGLKGIVDVGWADVKDYYAKADVFVMPSVEDGWGLVLQEAMAAGLPVVVTENTGAKDALEKDTGFLVPAYDSQVLFEKMQYFLTHSDKAKSMGSAAQKAVEKYSWDRYGTRLLKNYHRAA